MPNGTYKLENLYQMPCSCEVCCTYTPDDLRKMPKDARMKLIAQHNLNISFAEIRLIKQSISEGSLWELVEERCRVHPYLLEALRNLKKYTSKIEKYDPSNKKSAFFYTGSESLQRVEINRHLNKLKRLSISKRLLILPPSEKPYSKNISLNINNFYSNIENLNLNVLGTSDDLQVIVVDVPFAIIPLEIDEVYPLAQNESPSTLDEDAKKFVYRILMNHLNKYEEVIISADIMKMFENSLESSLKSQLKYEYKNSSLNIDLDDERRVKYIADYQFGSGSGKALFNGNINIVKSKKTGKIRHVYDNDKLIATLRASDGVLVLGKEGALRLHRYLPYPHNRVIVNEEAEPFAVEGKSIFAKFIIDCDSNIRSSEEILIVNSKDELLAFGRSILCGPEMMDFKTGQAVKTRKGGF
jgi:7-cyano-7-deazaguanine tRNA-ribosyltransferase